MRKSDMILAEVRDLRSEFNAVHGELRAELRAELRSIHGRIDSLHQRVDTVIDSLADLRSDFDRHTHDN